MRVFQTARNRWHFFSALGWLSVTVLWAARWPVLPLFLDPWYHLMVLQEMLRSGGIISQNMWYATTAGGVPHLYPPLFHLLLLVLWKCGLCDPLLLARLVSVILPALLLWVWWRVVGRLLGWRFGAWLLLGLAFSATFIPESSITLPATLVLIFAGWVWWSVERGRWLAGGLLLGLAFYTHLALPWLLAAALLIYGWWSGSERKGVAVRATILGVVTGLPWWWHVLAHRQGLWVTPLHENVYLQLYPALFALAAAALVGRWRRGGLWRFPAALLAASLPMLPVFSYRLFNNQGLLPLALLAAFGCEELIVWLRSLARPLKTAAIAVAVAIGCAYPSVAYDEQGAHWRWMDNGVARLVAGNLQFGPKELPIYSKYTRELAEPIRRYTAPEELLWCNFDHVGFLLGVLTDRSVGFGKRRQEELTPEAAARARLLVWIKDPERDLGPPLARLAQRHGLQMVGETEIAYLLRNPLPTGRRMTARAVMPWSVAVGLLVGAVGVIWWDLRRETKKA